MQLIPSSQLSPAVCLYASRYVFGTRRWERAGKFLLETRVQPAVLLNADFVYPDIKYVRTCRKSMGEENDNGLRLRSRLENARPFWRTRNEHVARIFFCVATVKRPGAKQISRVPLKESPV